MSFKRPEKSSPIKEHPLRVPGQSLVTQINDHIDDKVFTWWLYAAFLWAMVLMEWMRWFFNSPISPWTITAIALIATPFCLWRAWRGLQVVRQIRLGLDGERSVAQALHEGCPKGYFVIHDIEEKNPDGSRFNIDHVLIGPGGIFVIETKTRTKPTPDAKLHVDARGIRLADGPPDEHPIRQVLANVSHLRKILERTTHSTNIPIQPVVMYPGWYVKGKRNDVWVQNTDTFLKYINNRWSRLGHVLNLL